VIQPSRGIPAYPALMQRTNTLELLDSDAGSPRDIQATLQDLCRMNRWFGGVATTYSMVERVVAATGTKHLSLLEVAAGFGEAPRTTAKRLARRGVVLDFTLLDRAPSHLPTRSGAVVADALALLSAMQLSTWSAAICLRTTLIHPSCYTSYAMRCESAVALC